MSDNSKLTIIESNSLIQLGQVANEYAAQSAFSDYHSRRAENTKRRQRNDLNLFADFLNIAGVNIAGYDLYTYAEAWQGVTHGLIEGFIRWSLAQGYAVGSINVRLATLKAYCKLAAKAGVIPESEYGLIKTVSGHTKKDARRVDETRQKDGLPTRIIQENTPNKKATHVSLDKAQIAALKTQPDTPQGRRDAVLMCLLLDHGLRCGEVASLVVKDFNLKAGTMTFYRPKVDTIQTHQLTKDTLKALRAYFDTGDATFNDSKLLRSSHKGGNLTTAGMTERAITARVRKLGLQIGVPNLSAHDCRHSWATRASRNKTSPFALQEAGGWNSLAMPRLYTEAAKIANEGVILE